MYLGMKEINIAYFNYSRYVRRSKSKFGNKERSAVSRLCLVSAFVLVIVMNALTKGV